MKQLVALFLAVTLPLIGADAAWENLKVVQPGQKLRIRYMAGEIPRMSEGTMVAWTEDSLAVRLSKGDLTVPKNDVRQVSMDAGKNRNKGAGYGFLVGAAAGGGILGTASAADTGSGKFTSARSHAA